MGLTAEDLIDMQLRFTRQLTSFSNDGNSKYSQNYQVPSFSTAKIDNNSEQKE
jgi:hypothetical protein